MRKIKEGWAYEEQCHEWCTNDESRDDGGNVDGGRKEIGSGQGTATSVYEKERGWLRRQMAMRNEGGGGSNGKKG
ncbi:hypothetical protein GOBAR_AA16517 [Gossypium barbadense]|uniref:Uncharacterized protein n=1 Tax=Gossypium barbadense TaxID=3634 RepID=A0A2P5XLD7_GOSBA|nr:hypothetical protein GOBAR_AA16517 [Gossypium barbadense]